ncbi:hypothetical protein E5347_11345 [Clostridium sartagoforme]|uniref:histidine kinase n=1 Tax=Clostridium sartagoforme TaxID=84031 RepID=A0A4S2DLM8_9CLOT|nr:HAMP domain-containing sensor histidine kinase [Clostridium sartagoforme]TGY41904.1 hypothetical protein E5347_11345 [Clostridium sartagoforme]
MDYNAFREKIYYMTPKDLLTYVFYSVIAYCIFEIMSFRYTEIVYDIVGLLSLIICMILIMFSMHLKNLTKKEIYGLVQLVLFITMIVIIISITPEYYFIDFKIFLSKIGFLSFNTLKYNNLIIMYFIIAKYRVSEVNSKIIYFEYILLLVILSFLGCINNKYEYMFLGLIYRISSLVLIFKAYKYICKSGVKFDGKVDLLKINLNFATLNLFVRLFSNIFNIYMVIDLIDILMRIIFIAILVSIVFNITKENYNFIFKETVNTSKYLEEINNKIIKNNYKLEVAYKKIKDKQQLYKSFLSSLPHPIVIVNRNLRISYCNLNFLNSIGEKNLRRVVNRRIESYIDISSSTKEILSGFNKNEKVSYSTSITINGKQFECRFLGLNTEENEFILLLKDLTEELKLRDMKEELESIKMKEEIKKNFLSNISHDLKIPVNIIYSAIQLEKILIDNNDIDKLAFYNEIGKENCFILTKFTNNLIDISKIDSSNLEANLIYDNIVVFIEDYLISLNTYIKNSGINLLFDTEEEEIYTYFDTEMMQRVILNLVSNSIKFTKKGGTIFTRIKVELDLVIIEIGDNGEGMSEEFVKKAFNKYEMEERAKTYNPNGSGVGLFVVYNLIKAQNGNVEIKSEEGNGTTFRISFNKGKGA